MPEHPADSDAPASPPQPGLWRLGSLPAGLAVLVGILGGIGAAMIIGQQKLSSQVATLTAQMGYVSTGVAEFYKWRLQQYETERRRKDTGKQP